MRSTPIKHSGVLWVALVVLLVSATAMQVAVEGKLQRPATIPGVHWIQSPGLMRRLTVGFNADRKSTRLNSSHSQISYAVFCLKKKKTLLSARAALPAFA